LTFYGFLWAVLAGFILAIAQLISGIHMVFVGVSKVLVKYIQVVQVSLAKLENLNWDEPLELVK